MNRASDIVFSFTYAAKTGTLLRFVAEIKQRKSEWMRGEREKKRVRIYQQLSFLMEPRSDCLERAITISSVRRVIFLFDVFRVGFYSVFVVVVSLGEWVCMCFLSWGDSSARRQWNRFTLTIKWFPMFRYLIKCTHIHADTYQFFSFFGHLRQYGNYSDDWNPHLVGIVEFTHWAHISHTITNRNRDNLRDTNVGEDKTNNNSNKMKIEIKQNKTMTINWKTQMLRFPFDSFHRHELNDFFLCFYSVVNENERWNKSTIIDIPNWNESK